MNPVRKFFKGLGWVFAVVFILGTIFCPYFAYGDDMAKRCQLLFSEGRYQKSFSFCKKAAICGNALAQYNLGWMYEFGYGVQKDESEAFKWFKMSAEQGHVDAQFMLGWIYEDGHGVAKNYAKAIEWYQKAADKGNERAKYHIGLLKKKIEEIKHREGELEKLSDKQKCIYFFNNKNFIKAFYCCEQAAKQGSILAQTYLGMMYLFGQGIKKDYSKAVKLFKKAAKHGSPYAENLLGIIYERGFGVKKDYIKAIRWYRKSAGKGFAAAQYSMGVMYEFGRGVKRNYKKAVKWYLEAAKQDFGLAQFRLGVAYVYGRGVEKNYSEAVKWYRKAAIQGNAMAQVGLGWAYANGKGVRKDYTEAVKWYRKAAIQGDSMAQLSLGVLYEKGQGVIRDYTEAVKWYRKAANQGNAMAQFNLGVNYERGLGVAKNYEKAIEWYRKAAMQGNAMAQFNLGGMYAFGKGVMISGAAAADWYYKAGLSFLKKGKKDDALRCVERIKSLHNVLFLTVPNSFLADKLLAAIYIHNHKKKKILKKHPSLQVSLGTGWPVKGGFVVTNHHVVAGHKKIIILRRDGMKLFGSVAMDDRINDLVLIRVKNVGQLPPALPLAQGTARVGAKIFTIGYPNPGLMGSEPKLTNGIISSLTGVGDDPRTYQITVPLQVGNSGGPLLNMRGEVVGITTFKLNAAKVFKWTGDLPQNVNYAVKVAYLKVLLASVSSKHKISVLPARSGTLEDLAARIENSVLIVIAK